MQRAKVVAGVEVAFASSYLREVALKLPLPAAQAIKKGRELGVLLGVDGAAFGKDSANLLLVAATEKRTKAEIDQWAAALAQAVKGGAR